nr:hypothetical protein [Tanacetum cinerariifolium]
MELDLEARIIGETLVLNRSLDPLYGDYIELDDLNVPLELRRDKVDDLMPTIEEGEVIDEPIIDIIKTRNNESFDEYPSFCDFDQKIHIDCAYNLRFLCMIVRAGGQYLRRNFVLRSSQVVIEPDGLFLSQRLAAPVRDIGKALSITSRDPPKEPAIYTLEKSVGQTLPQISRKLVTREVAPSVGLKHNYILKVSPKPYPSPSHPLEDLEENPSHHPEKSIFPAFERIERLGMETRNGDIIFFLPLLYSNLPVGKLSSKGPKNNQLGDMHPKILKNTQKEGIKRKEEIGKLNKESVYDNLPLGKITNMIV